MSRNVVRVPIYADFLALFIKSSQRTTFAIQSDVPEDAKAIGISYDPITNAVNVFFEHESFSHVAEGAAPPAVQVTAVKDLRPSDDEVWALLTELQKAIYAGNIDDAKAKVNFLHSVFEPKGEDW